MSRIVAKFNPQAYAIHYKNGIVSFSKNDSVLVNFENKEVKGKIVEFNPESESVLILTETNIKPIKIHSKNILRKSWNIEKNEFYACKTIKFIL